MPSGRRSIVRQALPRIDPETLRLFRRLEGTRPSKRDRGDERKLAEALDLEDEFWYGQSVLNRRTKPCCQPPYMAYDAFYRCRLVRELLLEAMKKNPAQQSTG
jgi:hypothetical protein